MSNLTFLAYCRRLWESLPLQAKHWARDQIIWPPIMSLAITLFGAVVTENNVNWRVFRAGLWLYAVVFVTFGLLQFIRAGWKAYQERDSLIAEKAAYIQHLSEVISRDNKTHQETGYDLSRAIAITNRLQKELNVARVDLINAKDKIEFLTWPADRPILSFFAWGQIQPQFLPPNNNDQSLYAQYGFYFVNDGGTALEIEVEDFQITNLLIAIGGKLGRIEGGGDKGFVPVWIKDEVPLSRWCLDIALEAAWEEKVNEKVLDPWLRQPMEFPVSAIYRDHNQLWYRSIATIKYFAGSMYQDHIEFGPITQEKHGLTKPVIRKL